MKSITFLSMIFLLMFACTNPTTSSSKISTRPKPPLDQAPPKIKAPPETIAKKDPIDTSYQQEKVRYEKGSLLFKTTLTNHYNGMIPETALLIDYPSSGQFGISPILAVANLGPQFERKLPKSITDELARRDLLGKNLVDIFWVVQNNVLLGEAEDHNRVPTTTRISIHGWADKTAPTNYVGTRINRNFLLGFFDPEHDLNTKDFSAQTLVSHPVHTHDQLFSPRASTNLIKISHQSPSQSFWILAIDNLNPEQQIRALVTFFWILNEEDSNEFRDLSLRRSSTDLYTFEPSFTNFGDLLELLKNKKPFNNSEMLQRLDNIFN